MEFFFAKRAATLIALGTALGTVIACGSFSGAPTMEEHLLSADSGPSTDPVRQTIGPAEDSGGVDSGVDAGAIEDGGDSTSDASAACTIPENSAAACLQRTHLLCDDFSNMADWGSWSTVTSHGGTVTHGCNGTFFAIAPATPHDAGSEPVTAQLMMSGNGGTKKRITCSFRVWPTATPLSSSLGQLAELLIAQTGEPVNAGMNVDYRLQLNSEWNRSSVQEGIVSQNFASMAKILPARWTLIEIAVQFGPSGSVTISYDGTAQGTSTLTQAAQRNFPMAGVTLLLGMNRGSQQDDALAAYYDDAKCDVSDP